MSTKRNFPLLLFVLFLLVEVIIFILQKVVSITAEGNGLEFYISLLTKPWLWISLVFALIQLFLWTSILSKDDLSRMYSISSISYPLTMVASTFLFGEHLSWMVWLGAMMITAGVFIVGSESGQKSI